MCSTPTGLVGILRVASGIIHLTLVAVAEDLRTERREGREEKSEGRKKGRKEGEGEREVRER